MRFRVPLIALLFVIVSFALPTAAHAGIPFFGPIIPPQSITGVQGSDVCAASWGMLIVVINNIISFLITLAIVFVTPIMIAYAGFLYVVNPVDPSGIKKAKEILMNTVIGIVVALAGWLIVDAVMAVLTTGPDGPTFARNWSSIITGNAKDLCIPLASSLNQAAQQNTVGVSTGALNSVSTGNLVDTACDPAAVQVAAKAGGGLTNTEANILACIAKPESSCGARNLNYSWNKPNAKGKASTAAGAFQVLLSSNHSCYENTACQKAAGVNGTLDCQKGFGPNGFTAGGDPTVLDYCTKAAANLNCSASAAACLLKQNGGSFSPWQADVNNAVQSGCINKGV